MRAYNAFLGEVVEVDATTLNGLQAQIEAKLGISGKNQLILVPPKGAVLKPEALGQAVDLHVYDKRIMKTESSLALPSGDISGLLAKDHFAAISLLKTKTANILESTRLCAAHMSLHTSQFLKGWAKKAALFKQVKQDIESCKGWETVWSKMQFADTQLLDYKTTRDSWQRAQNLEASLDAQLVPPVIEIELPHPQPPQQQALDDNMLKRDMDTLQSRLDTAGETMRLEIEQELEQIAQEAEAAHSQARQNFAAAQSTLQATIRAVAQGQSELATNKSKLAQLSLQIVELDSCKMQVAKVLDFPYILGIAIAEKSRRHVWALGMEQEAIAADDRLQALRAEEDARIAKWSSHYSKLQFVDELVEQQTDEADVWAYIDSLRGAGLEDVCEDLSSEVHAISHELEQSFRFGRQHEDRTERGERRLSQVGTAARPVGSRRQSLEKVDKESATQKELAQLRNDLDRTKSKLASIQKELGQVQSDFGVAQEELLKARGDLEAAEIELSQTRINLVSTQKELEEALEPPEHASQTAPEPPSHSLIDKTSDLAQRLFANSHNLEQVLEKMGLQTSRKLVDGRISYQVNRVRGLRRSSRDLQEPRIQQAIPMLNWVHSDNDEDFEQFMQEIYIDYDMFRQAVTDRFGEVERIARKYHNQTKSDREKLRQQEKQLRNRLALGQFTVGDLILFLPTRDSAKVPNPWAAFNVNSPHYFLDPASAAQLGGREFIIGRATKIEEHKVGEGANPFGLPDGLQWFLVGASWR